jgi:hypothetical protein
MIVILKTTKGEVELKTSKHFDYFLYVTNHVQLGVSGALLQNILKTHKFRTGVQDSHENKEESCGQSQVIYK